MHNPSPSLLPNIRHCSSSVMENQDTSTAHRFPPKLTLAVSLESNRSGFPPRIQNPRRKIVTTPVRDYNKLHKLVN